MRSLFLLIALAACAEEQGARDSTVREDASQDAGTGEDASDRDAASADAAFDSGVVRDAAVIDGSLAGTSLEGIALEWDQELLRCADWVMGEDLDRALAQQVQVALPPHPRTSLEPADLAGAQLTAGSVHRSPFSADQWSIAGSSSTLIEWTLTPPADSAHLSATIAHDLGPAGTLFESIGVRRQSGDRSPVRYGNDDEVSFGYQPPGGELFLLAPCGGEPDLETAVVVLSAFDGNDWITLMREQKTRLAPAGSAPVYPTRSEAIFSWQPAWTEAFLADGYWTQVYTATLHNWNEQALVRFDRDLRWNYLVFAPLQRGEMPGYPPRMPESIRLSGLNSPGGQGTLSLSELELPSGAASNRTFDVEVDWHRVDETHLERSLFGCPSPEIVPLWGVSGNGVIYLFELGFCQANSPITDLDLFVPIYFSPDPHLAGTLFDKTAISAVDVGGSPGVEIALGSHYLQIAEPGAYHAIVQSSARALIEELDVYQTALFETAPFARMPETVTGASDDGTVRATLVRQWIAQGAGNSSIFAPVSFELSFAGETHRVVAWDKLEYLNSHHNWDDTLETDDGVLRMFWRVLEFGGAYEVRAERYADGVEVLPPTTVRR